MADAISPDTTNNSKTKPNFNKTRLGCWTNEKINSQLKVLTQELDSKSNNISISRKKRIKERVNTLKKALSGQVSVGGQIPKKVKPFLKNSFEHKHGSLKTNMTSSEKANTSTKKIHKSIKCLRCRRGGHKLSDCPLNLHLNSTYNVTKNCSQSQKMKASLHGFCFNCGKCDHTLKNCKSKRCEDGSLPYAICFICNTKGHISSQCNQNPKGMYPNGGGCRICGSVYHKQSQCPEKQKSKFTFKKPNPTSKSQNLLGMNTGTFSDPDDFWQSKL